MEFDDLSDSSIHGFGFAAHRNEIEKFTTSEKHKGISDEQNWKTTHPDP